MNRHSFNHKRQRGGMLRAAWHGLGAGCLKVLQLFGESGGTPPSRVVSLQKRELEEKLLAAGYSRKLALIAVSEAFKPTAQSD
ncbi:MAG: hypothetical protein AB1418_04125 [Pseudomonadota bacterium]